MSVPSVLREIATSLRKRPLPLELPRTLQLPINDVCNAQCQMCHIWKQKKDREIGPEEIEQILSSRLFRKIRAVGLNGGEPTLRKDLPEIGAALFRALPRLRFVNVITNALAHKVVTNRVRDLASVVAENEGPTRGHGLRGRRGRGSQSCPRERRELRRRRESHRSATGAPRRLAARPRVHRDSRERRPYRRRARLRHRAGALREVSASAFRTAGSTRKASVSRSISTSISDTTWRHFSGASETTTSRRRGSASSTDSLIGQLVAGEPRKAGCDWQHRAATLTSRGELLYCAVESRVLGSALDEDPKALYYENRSHLEAIVASKCDGCAHDYVGLLPAGSLTRHYFRRSLEKLGWPVERVRKLPIVRGVLAARRRRRFLRRTQSLGGVTTLGPMPKRSIENLSSNARVLAVGWYGTETLGDKAILAGVVDVLRRSPSGPLALAGESRTVGVRDDRPPAP